MSSKDEKCEICEKPKHIFFDAEKYFKGIDKNHDG